jgi:hypothetical protein
MRRGQSTRALTAERQIVALPPWLMGEIMTNHPSLTDPQSWLTAVVAAVWLTMVLFMVAYIAE